MFYTIDLLSRKGPLAALWLAAHFRHKLSKAQVGAINIAQYCKMLEEGPNLSGSASTVSAGGKVPLALRINGQLLLGLVRIYDSKVRFLVEDAENVTRLLKSVREQIQQGRAATTLSVGAADSKIETDRQTPQGNEGKTRRGRYAEDSDEKSSSDRTLLSPSKPAVAASRQLRSEGAHVFDLIPDIDIDELVSRVNEANAAGDGDEMALEISAHDGQLNISDDWRRNSGRSDASIEIARAEQPIAADAAIGRQSLGLSLGGLGDGMLPEDEEDDLFRASQPNRDRESLIEIPRAELEEKAPMDEARISLASALDQPAPLGEMMEEEPFFEELPVAPDVSSPIRASGVADTVADIGTEEEEEKRPVVKAPRRKSRRALQRDDNTELTDYELKSMLEDTSDIVAENGRPTLTFHRPQRKQEVIKGIFKEKEKNKGRPKKEEKKQSESKRGRRRVQEEVEEVVDEDEESNQDALNLSVTVSEFPASAPPPAESAIVSASDSLPLRLSSSISALNTSLLPIPAVAHIDFPQAPSGASSTSDYLAPELLQMFQRHLSFTPKKAKRKQEQEEEEKGEHKTEEEAEKWEAEEKQKEDHPAAAEMLEDDLFPAMEHPDEAQAFVPDSAADFATDVPVESTEEGSEPFTVSALDLLRDEFSTKGKGKRGSAAARSSLQFREDLSSGLKKQGLELTPKRAASLFYQLLVLKSSGVVEVQQQQSFGSIAIEKGENFEQPHPASESQ